MLARDLACAALGWAIALAYWVGASRLQRSMLSDEFGADGLPRGLAMLLAAVSTLIALRALWLARRVPPQPAALGPGLRLHAKALGGVAALGCLYLVLAPWAGYLIACGVLIYVTALYYGAKPTPLLAAVSIGGAVFFWWMFARLLSVSMPAGFWPQLLG